MALSRPETNFAGKYQRLDRRRHRAQEAFGYRRVASVSLPQEVAKTLDSHAAYYGDKERTYAREKFGRKTLSDRIVRR